MRILWEREHSEWFGGVPNRVSAGQEFGDQDSQERVNATEHNKETGIRFPDHTERDKTGASAERWRFVDKGRYKRLSLMKAKG